MKPDEQLLLKELQERSKLGQVYVRDLVHELGIPEKRTAYIFEKWTGKGWYDWGVSVMARWLTEEEKMVDGGII